MSLPRSRSCCVVKQSKVLVGLTILVFLLLVVYLGIVVVVMPLRFISISISDEAHTPLWNALPPTRIASKKKNDFYYNTYDDEKMKRSIPWEELSRDSVFANHRRKSYPPLGMPIILPKHLPLPIFVLNMPKSGSTSIHEYFECGMGKGFAVHYAYNLKVLTESERERIHPGVLTAGICMGHNRINDRPLVEGCGGFAVYSDAGMMIQDTLGHHDAVLDWKVHNNSNHQNLTKHDLFELPRRDWCFYPGVHALENIVKHYPYATILHLPRNAQDWVRSSTAWGQKRTMLERYHLRCHGFDNHTFHPPPLTEAERNKRLLERNIAKQQQNQQHHRRKNKTEAEWANWYKHDYTNRIRRFATNHPTLTYFESPLEDPNTPIRLEEATGIDRSCFGHKLKTFDRNKLVAKQKKRRKSRLQKEAAEKREQYHQTKKDKQQQQQQQTLPAA